MTSWKSEFYCSNSDVIFLVTSSSLHKNQLVDKNLPFLINDNACKNDFRLFTKSADFYLSKRHGFVVSDIKSAHCSFLTVFFLQFLTFLVPDAPDTLPWSTAVVKSVAFGFFEGGRRYCPPAVWANPRQTTADVSDVKQTTGLFAYFGDIWPMASLLPKVFEKN